VSLTRSLMPDTDKRLAQLVSELDELSGEQLDSRETAVYVGWSVEEGAAYVERGIKISALR
jgi:hypothetical protein